MIPDPLPLDAPLHACFAPAECARITLLLRRATGYLIDASDLCARHPEAGHPTVMALTTHLRLLSGGIASAVAALTPPPEPPDAV